MNAHLECAAKLREVRNRVTAMCRENRPPRMSIPARQDDDDIFIAEALDETIALLHKTNTQRIKESQRK